MRYPFSIACPLLLCRIAGQSSLIPLKLVASPDGLLSNSAPGFPVELIGVDALQLGTRTEIDLYVADHTHQCNILYQADPAKSLLCLVAGLFSVTATCSAASTYPTRLDDPAAVYLTAEEFHVHADGQETIAHLFQAAIDKLQAGKGESIVFVPQGRYRIQPHHLSLAGCAHHRLQGPERPVFVLSENTPRIPGRHCLHVLFAGARPRPQAAGAASCHHPPPTPRGAGGLSQPRGSRRQPRYLLYSAMSNVDFEIGPGNASLRSPFASTPRSTLFSATSRFPTSAPVLPACMKSPTRLRISTSTAASSASWRANLLPAWQFTLSSIPPLTASGKCRHPRKRSTASPWSTSSSAMFPLQSRSIHATPIGFGSKVTASRTSPGPQL